MRVGNTIQRQVRGNVVHEFFLPQQIGQSVDRALAIGSADVSAAALRGRGMARCDLGDFAGALGDFDRAADALGHISVTEQTLRLASVLEDTGDTSARSDLLQESADALERRGVLPGVVQELRSR